MFANRAHHLNTLRGSSTSADAGGSLPITAWVLALVTVMALLLPDPLVVMLLSTVLVLAGFLAAGYVALKHRNSAAPLADRMLLPGLIVFFGFAASILGDPDAAVMSLQQHLR